MSWGFGFFFLFIISFLYNPLYSDEIDSKQILELKTWEYRWGDSPLDDKGIPKWSNEVSNEWQNSIFPSQAKARQNNNYLWQRVKIPKNSLQNPAIYIESLDLVYETYWKGKKIHSFGDLANGNSYAGFSWHLIQFSNTEQDEYLYFRILGDPSYASIGIYGVPEFGELKNILHRRIIGDIDRIIFCVLFAFASILSLSFFILRRNEMHYFWFFLYSLLSSIWILSKTFLRIYIYNSTYLWPYLEYITVYLLLGVFLLYYRSLFNLFKVKFLAILNYLTILSGIGCIFYLVYPPLAPNKFLIAQPIIRILVFVNIAGFLYFTFKKKFDKRTTEHKFIIIGIIINSIFVLYDIFGGLGFYPYPRSLANLGFGALNFSFIGVMILRFSETYKKLGVYSKELERLSGIKDAFLSNLSHELRTPLTVIRSYSEMLEMVKDKPEQVVKYGNAILASSIKINDYVDDLMLITEIESNISLTKEKINLNELVQDQIKNLQIISDEKKISWHINIPNEFAITVDIKLFEKIIYAILKNAIVYNHVEGKIIVEATKISNQIRIEISDSGIGISKEESIRIFEKFYRVDSSDTYSVSGVGLGLFIAKKIMELHSGIIELDSELGKGSKFVLILPENEK